MVFGSIFSSSKASSSKDSERAPRRSSTYSDTSNRHRDLVPYVGPSRYSTSRSQGGRSGASTRPPLSAYSEQPRGDQSDGGYQSVGGMTTLQQRGFFENNAPPDYFHNDDVRDQWDSLHPPKREPPKAPRDPYRPPRYAATKDRGECDAVTTAPSGVSTVHPRRYREPVTKSVNYAEGEGDDLESVAPKDSISQVSSNPGNRYKPASHRGPPPAQYTRQPSPSMASGSTAQTYTSSQIRGIVAGAIEDDRKRRGRR
jgi:hypothetical protein